MKILVLEFAQCNLAYLGCYGNEWVATPNLDRLAAEGIVFDEHFAGSAPIRFEPATHRTIDAIDDLPDLADELLAEDGVVWIAGPRLGPPWEEGACITDYADDNERTPWFGSGNRVTPDDVPACCDTYAGTITYFDAQLGNLLEALDDTDWTIVVTASDGLSIDELATTGPGIGEESVHLPLIVHFADRRYAGERISALTQPNDLAATLRTLLELPAEIAAGRDLMPLVRGEAESLRPSVVSVHGEAASLRTAEWALLRTVESASRLFVKPDDRWEVNDVAQHHPEIVESLEAELARMTGEAK